MSLFFPCLSGYHFYPCLLFSPLFSSLPLTLLFLLQSSTIFAYVHFFLPFISPRIIFHGALCQISRFLFRRCLFGAAFSVLAFPFYSARGHFFVPPDSSLSIFLPRPLFLFSCLPRCSVSVRFFSIVPSFLSWLLFLYQFFDLDSCFTLLFIVLKCLVFIALHFPASVLLLLLSPSIFRQDLRFLLFFYFRSLFLIIFKCLVFISLPSISSLFPRPFYCSFFFLPPYNRSPFSFLLALILISCHFFLFS